MIKNLEPSSDPYGAPAVRVIPKRQPTSLGERQTACQEVLITSRNLPRIMASDIMFDSLERRVIGL